MRCSGRLFKWRLFGRAAGLLVVATVVVLVGIYLQPTINRAVAFLNGQPVLGPVLYVVLSASAITFLPLSSLPLLPVAAAAWGVVGAGTLSILGWWLGSLAAFIIARVFGRPVLRWVVSVKRLDKWEDRIPGHATFFSIVLLRLIFPVEIPSYILGLSKNIRFPVYATATLVGIIPFAYAMTAMGGALAEQQWLQLVVIGVGGAAALYALFLLWRRSQKRERAEEKRDMTVKSGMRVTKAEQGGDKCGEPEKGMTR